MDFVAVPAGTTPDQALLIRGSDHDLELATADPFIAVAVLACLGLAESRYFNIAGGPKDGIAIKRAHDWLVDQGFGRFANSRPPNSSDACGRA